MQQPDNDGYNQHHQSIMPPIPRDELPVARRPCDECGLPLSICTALAMYRSTVKAFAEGDIASANKYREMAEEAEADYRKAMDDHATAQPPREWTQPVKPLA